MLDFTYYSPTRFIFGTGREKEAGCLAKDCGAKRVLIHYGGGSAVRSGLLERVRRSLETAGLTWVELGGVVPNPRDTLVYQGIDICRREQIDLVLAVGGGSVLDSAKAIALGACYDGDFWDLFSQAAKPQKRLSLGTIITLPATGSEGSNSAVITRSAESLKRGLRSDLNRPDFSIINPELTFGLPAWQLACGAADILSHVFERYFTRVPEVALSDRLCEAVMSTVLEAAPQALGDPQAYGPRADLMWASTIAHVGLLGMGRQEDWSVHALEHELSGLYDVAHGAGLAALYPAWMQYVLPHDPNRFDQLATRVLGAENGPDGIKRLAAAFRSWGLPVNLRGLGVKYDDLPRLASRVKRNPDGSCGFYLPLQDADITAIYELAYDWKEN
ncbi:MAG: iron-containing alcohol dehydrogenase [Clostridiaceae bacterium]|nr:iron-containing alcohol dehydrogenase [Clostridiaceae bacterium]